jgi:2EXR family
MFPLFPSLAPELKIKIWQHACQPRTVTVRYDSERDKCLSSSPPPAILQASHESRTEAQKEYKLCFGTASHPARIYFNPYHDTLYLPRHREMGYDETLRDFRTIVKDEGILDEVRRLAIEHVDPEVKRPWESYNKASLLREFRRLQEVVLVLLTAKDEKNGLDEGVVFVEPKGQLEALLRMWIDFRQSVVIEEKLLESVCREMGKAYESWSLPSVTIRSKMLRE